MTIFNTVCLMIIGILVLRLIHDVIDSLFGMLVEIRREEQAATQKQNNTRTEQRHVEYIRKAS